MKEIKGYFSQMVNTHYMFQILQTIKHGKKDVNDIRPPDHKLPPLCVCLLHAEGLS